MTVDPAYVPSGFPENNSAKEEELSSSTEDGKLPSPMKEEEQASSRAGLRSRRESRKAPFSLPPLSRSSIHFPREYRFDGDLDRILEDQRIADEKSPMEAPAPAKRKREDLSDQD
jgi:hypothetical protein